MEKYLQFLVMEVGSDAVHNNVLALSSLLVPMEEGAVMATLDEHSEQSTIKGIRQLLSAVQTLHHNSSSDSSVKEIMEHLESVDVNFHSYDLVCSIRKRIDEAIGPLVESRLEESVVEGDGHDTVPLILDEVLASNEDKGNSSFQALERKPDGGSLETYTGVCQAIVSSVESAVDSMLLDSSSLMISPDQPSSVSSTSSATQYFNLDDSISSEFSSAVNQTGLMFMPLEQIKGIVEHLGSHQQIDVRLRAMRSLHQFPPGDLLANENWPELKQSLQKTLKDPNASLSDLSLKLLARMFSSHTPKATKEAYSCLVEHLKWYFEDQHQPIVMGKIDIGESNDVRLLKKFRLLNEFQKDVTTFWVRYNESIIRQMAADTFGLLSVCCGNSQLLTPFHFFALLDPKAQWFRKWMHGYYGRTEVLQQLKSFPSILKTYLKQIFDFPSIKTFQTRPAKDGEFEMVYRLVELDTLLFTHCMSMLERLLLYKSGRQLFPVQLDGNNVHIDDLLIKLVEIVFCHPTGSHDMIPAERDLDPSHMAIHLIKEVAQGNEMCQEILCKDSILLSLVHPIRKLQEGQPSHTNEVVLLAIADLIAQLATSSKGLHCLLWGETGQKWQINKSAVAHVISQFVAMSLDGSLTTKPSASVTLAYLFVCRQLYKTGEGLMTLLQYSLHNLIAMAWRMAKDNEDGCYSPWKESLVDNLLNFAATPKGLLLLQQSGALESCTSYMFHRYKLKLQVSKCEKFGYGCMVTQVAATSPGMLALLNTGFVSEFVSDLWSLLEEGDDYHLVLSSSDPLDPSNRAAHKAMINLLNILSSYPALYEALSEPHRHHQARRHSSNDPTTVFELIDRLVLVDCSPKMTSLLNFQEAHLFGLRLFGIIMTCLDSYLLLESQYNICDALLALQKDCALDQGSYILDACSLERNRIIVSTNIIGGPSERMLPSHTLVQDTDSCYPWPLFSSFPVPTAYRPQYTSVVDSKDQSSAELLSSLNSPVSSNGQWIDKVKETFCNMLFTKQWLSTDTILVLLSRCLPVVRSMDSSQFSPISTDLANSNVIPDQMDILGVQLVHKYGVYLGLVQDNSGTMNDLHVVLSTIKMQLKAQQYSNKPTLGFLKTSQAGFDWFVATVFLITRGSLQVTLNTLQEISCLLTSAYLWPSRIHKSVHLPKSLAFSGIPPVFSVIMHLVELILQDEVPLCYSAFKLSGFTPSQICQHWLQQCFWNYLDWPEICLYIVVCIIMGTDYQVYMCVAILKYLEAQILEHTQEQSLLVFLKETSLSGFHVHQHLNYMQLLEQKFRMLILPDMLNLGKF